MVLCGISSRFQLLSPCVRQVTHALLTRPPLSYESLGFIITPFDLHVLSTPPAFILSQDQTLMLKVRPAKINYLALLFWFKDLHLLNVLENKIYSKNFQGCIVVYLSKFIRSFDQSVRDTYQTEKEGFEPSRRY